MGFVGIVGSYSGPKLMYRLIGCTLFAYNIKPNR